MRLHWFFDSLGDLIPGISKNERTSGSSVVCASVLFVKVGFFVQPSLDAVVTRGSNEVKRWCEFTI